MSKIDDLIEQATGRDFDFQHGHTATVDSEKLVRLVAQDCYNLCKELAKTNPWHKAAHVQDARAIADEYGLAFNNDDFIKFTEVKSGTDMFTLAEWKQDTDDGAINSDDGDGYWVKDGTLESDIDAFDSKPAWATHVSWYNK